MLRRDPSFFSRYRGLFGVAGFAAVIGVLLYPICIRPMMQVDSYKEQQAKYRAGFYPEDPQPPGLKPGSDSSGSK